MTTKTNVTHEGEWKKMKTKKWLIGLSALGVVGGGAYYLAPAIQENTIEQSETIKETKFEDLKEVKIEIMDTSAFSDKNIEKWFEKNKGKNGESLYYDNKYTYVMVSGGEKGNDSDVIWLDGVRQMNEKLIIGYEFKDAKEFGVTKKDDRTPTLLIRTEGEYKEVKGIVVEKKEVKPEKPKVTTTESKVEKKKEGASEEKEDKSDKDTVKSKEKEDKTKTDKEDEDKEKEAN